jgi:hypothetical protein
MGWKTRELGFDSQQEQRLQLLYSIQSSSAAYPAFYPVGTGSTSPRIKQPRCNADYSLPFSAMIRNRYAYTYKVFSFYVGLKHLKV